MSFSELTAIGNIGKPPEVTYNTEGREFCHFSIAVNEGTGKKDKEGKTIKDTIWYNVTCVGSLVNIAISYLKKGDSVFVRGKLKVRKYNGANGMDVSLELFANTIHLLPNNRANENQHGHIDDGSVVETDNTDFNPEEYEQELVQSPSSKTTDTNANEAMSQKWYKTNPEIVGSTNTSTDTNTGSTSNVNTRTSTKAIAKAK